MICDNDRQYCVGLIKSAERYFISPSLPDRTHIVMLSTTPPLSWFTSRRDDLAELIGRRLKSWLRKLEENDFYIHITANCSLIEILHHSWPRVQTAQVCTGIGRWTTPSFISDSLAFVPIIDGNGDWNEEWCYSPLPLYSTRPVITCHILGHQDTL